MVCHQERADPWQFPAPEGADAWLTDCLSLISRGFLVLEDGLHASVCLSSSGRAVPEE